MNKYIAIGTLMFLTLVTWRIEAAEWSRFRGPDGTGVDDSASLPEEFGPDDNVVWRVDVPYSNSSPVLTGNAVFITGSDDDNLVIMRLDATTGKIDWTRELKRARTSKIHAQNDSAASTPVIEGNNLYAFFQELGVVSFDLEGNHRWTLPLGPFKQFYGMASSPIVTKDLVVVQCDQQQSAYLVAIGKDDGAIRWKVDRSIRGSSWTTPVVIPAAGNTRSIVVHGNGYVDAYALHDGSHLWGSGGFGASPTTSPFLVGNRMFVTVSPSTEPDGSGFQLKPFEELTGSHDANGDSKLSQKELKGNILAGEFGWGDLDKDGFISQIEYETIYEEFYSEDYGITALDLDSSETGGEPQIAWRYRGPQLPYITTPLIYRNTVYFVDTKGHVNSLDAKTGDLVKRERISGMPSRFFASPIAGDGKVYFSGTTGKIAVLSADADWDVLSVNDLDERITATPAIGGGHLYVRTKKALHCIGDKF